MPLVRHGSSPRLPTRQPSELWRADHAGSRGPPERSRCGTAACRFSLHFSWLLDLFVLTEQPEQRAGPNPSIGQERRPRLLFWFKLPPRRLELGTLSLTFNNRLVAAAAGLLGADRGGLGVRSVGLCRRF